MQVPGSPCPAPAPGPTTSPVPLDVGGARGELCPGGQGVVLGPVPRRPWGQPVPAVPLTCCHPPRLLVAGDHQASRCTEEPPATLCAVPRHTGLPWGGIATLSHGTGAITPPGHSPPVSPFPLLLFPSGLPDLGSEVVPKPLRPGWAVPGAGSESLPVSRSQPALSRCLPAWFGAFAVPGGGQGGAGLALSVLPGAGTFSRCHKVTHMHHCTHPVVGWPPAATTAALEGHNGARPWGQPGCCWGCGAAGLGWQRLWRGQRTAGALWESLLAGG